MASAGLQDELNCSVCLSIFTDPVTLRCGHNFCRGCIDRVLDTQEGSGVYTCPDCREEFQQRPVLHRSIALRNIADHFHSTQPERRETGIFCTYCPRSSVPAVKYCQLCNVSLCPKHLRVHSKSDEHVLTDPTSPPENRTCPIHNKSLEYYCTKDKTCICVICSSAIDHKGHHVEVLDKALEKKKDKLRGFQKTLTSEREETEKRFQSLQKYKREVHKRATGEMKRVTALFRDIRRQLEDLEKRVLGEISLWEEQASFSTFNLIQNLEMKMDGLYSKILYVEELCNMTDPVTILQEQESERKDFCPAENEDRKRHDKTVLDVGDLEGSLISEAVHTGLSKILRDVEKSLNLKAPTDISLDVNTAGNYIHISDDLKVATHLQINQSRPETQQRFQCNQVLSTRSFASGKHCWEVEISKSGNLRVGMCYPSIEKSGYQSWIGDNRKSWCLCRWYYSNSDRYSVMYDGKVTQLPHKFACYKLRISLDYEAGQLSFYELGDPIKHLHTFTVTFTEPLHAALCILKDGFVKISG